MFDPFITLGFPVTFSVDAEELETAYFKGQSETHPDRFGMGSPEEKLRANQRAADINMAYQILKSPLRRAESILALKGLDPLGAGPSEESCLMEMMDLQEALAMQREGILAEIAQTYRESLAILADHFKTKNYDAARAELTRLKYLERLKGERRV